MRILPLVLSSLVFVACNGANTTGTGGAGGAGENPLVGIWYQQVTTGADMQSVTLEFGADLSVKTVHSQQNPDGCTEVCTTPGTYEYTAATVTLAPDTTANAGELVNCPDVATNGPVEASSCTPVGPGTFDYAVDAGSLTITIDGAQQVFTLL